MGIDSITHIILGATIGDALLGKKLGKRAMLLGALAQSIPDIDFLASLWNDTAAYLLVHRGFTHSIAFLFIATFFFALFADHYHKSHRIGFNKWFLFFAVQIGVHLFLDFYNSYGMGLMEPFSHERYSLNALFVADPFFSIWIFIAFIALLIVKSHIKKRIYWVRFALFFCTVYIILCTINKIRINQDVRLSISEPNENTQIFTTPTPFNNLLWYVVVKSDAGFYVGFRSIFDSRRKIDYTFFPQNSELLSQIADHEEVQQLIRFSQGFYTVEKWQDTLVFNDLRFGQIVGWHNPHEKFVFHYYLQHPDKENKMVVQRGRFLKWDKASIKSMITKIAVD